MKKTSCGFRTHLLHTWPFRFLSCPSEAHNFYLKMASDTILDTTRLKIKTILNLNNYQFLVSICRNVAASATVV